MCMCRNSTLLKGTGNSLSTKKMGFYFGIYLGPDEPHNHKVGRVVMAGEDENVFASTLISNMERLH